MTTCQWIWNQYSQLMTILMAEKPQVVHRSQTTVLSAVVCSTSSSGITGIYAESVTARCLHPTPNCSTTAFRHIDDTVVRCAVLFSLDVQTLSSMYTRSILVCQSPRYLLLAAVELLLFVLVCVECKNKTCWLVRLLRWLLNLTLPLSQFYKTNLCLSVCLSIHQNVLNVFSNFTEIWFVGKGRWVMHEYGI